MKIYYFADTDTAIIEFSNEIVAETKEISENLYIDLDNKGNLVSMTIEHSEIKCRGFNALAEKLDVVELERFIVLLNREKFDYTKWRKNLFEDMRIEEISSAAEKYSKKLYND